MCPTAECACRSHCISGPLKVRTTLVKMKDGPKSFQHVEVDKSSSLATQIKDLSCVVIRRFYSTTAGPKRLLKRELRSPEMTPTCAGESHSIWSWPSARRLVKLRAKPLESLELLRASTSQFPLKYLPFTTHHLRTDTDIPQ